ncbi:MAG: flagellar basal body rod protein FlgC [Alphaproteobacteria bacterium]
MGNDILNAIQVSAAGMKTQGTRVRVITENIANANTTGDTPGEDPYRRQTISFKNELDRELGFKLVSVDAIGVDNESQFPLEYRPDHPAADENGMVKMPNVKTLIEMQDAREAQRSYEANLGLLEQSRGMAQRTIDMLRN